MSFGFLTGFTCLVLVAVGGLIAYVIFAPKVSETVSGLDKLKGQNNETNELAEQQLRMAALLLDSGDCEGAEMVCNKLLNETDLSASQERTMKQILSVAKSPCHQPATS